MMPPIVTHVPLSVCLRVFRFVCLCTGNERHPCKTAELVDNSRCRLVCGLVWAAPKNHVLGGGLDPRRKYGYTWTCPDFSAVDIINLIRKKAAATRPLDSSTVSICFWLDCMRVKPE